MADKRELVANFIGRDESLGKTLKDLGDSADKASDKVEDLGEDVDQLGGKSREAALDAKTLSREIAGTERQVRDLAREIAKTGDLTLFRQLRRQQADLRKLLSVRDLVDDDDARNAGVRIGTRMADGAVSALAKAGGPVSDAIGGMFTALPPQAQAALGAGVLAAVALAAPLVTSALSGAIIAGLGAGALATGIAAAARDPEVKQAAEAIGTDMKTVWTGIGDDYRGEVLTALRDSRGDVAGIGHDLREALKPAKTYIDPLVAGLTGLTREVIPGIAAGIREAGPAIEAVAGRLPQIGAALGGLLSTMAEHAAEGADAFGTVLDLTTVLIAQTAGWVDLLATGWGWVDKIGNSRWGQALTGPLVGLLAGLGESEPKLRTFVKGSDDAAGALGRVGGAAHTSTTAVESFADALKRMRGENLSAEQANIRLEEAIDAAADAAKRNGDGIDANIPKQRANRQALMDIVAAAEQASAKILEQTGSQDLAAQATERGRAQFLKTAASMGVAAGEAQRLATMLFGIPADTYTKSHYDGSAVANGVKWTNTQLSKIPRRIFIQAKFDLINDAEVAMALRLGRLAGGGLVTGPGTGTSDSIPKMLSNGEFVVTAAATAQPGVLPMLEALNSGRRGVDSPAVSVSSPASPALSEVALTRAFAQALRQVPIVQLPDSARTADLYARGG